MLLFLLGWSSISFSQDCKALCDAIQIADLTTMEEILSKGTAADCEFAYKYTPKQKNPYFSAKSFSTKRIQSPVHFVAQADMDYTKLIGLLKSHKVDLNKKDNTGQALIHLAAETKNEELLALLLNENIDFNAIDQKGNAVLSLMIDNDTEIELVKAYIKKGAKVPQTSQQSSALYQAFKHNRTDIAEILLKHKAKINEQNKQGTSCLDAAIENRNKALIELAFKHGADASNADIKNLIDEVLIKLLVERGASPSAVDLNNIIAYTQNTELAQWLLVKGANPDQKGFLGQTPMFHAIRQNNVEMVKTLINSNADLNHKIEKGENYLTVATYNQPSFNQNIVKLLLENGVAEWGMYKALEKAIVQEDMLKIETLMAAGMDISKATIRSVNNPIIAQKLLDRGASIRNFDLESIVKTGNVQMIQFLFVKGMNIEARNAIYYAVSHQETPILSYLLKNGYNPNLLFQEGEWGYTPLMKAIQNKDLVTIKMLVEANANTHTINDKGESVLQMAVLSRSIDVLDYLLEKGANFETKTSLETTNLVKTCIEEELTDILKKLVHFGLDLKNISLADFMEGDNTYILEVLINQNVDANTPNEEGQTPLFVAFNKRYYKTIHFLLKNGADIDGICLSEFMTQQPRLDYNTIEFLVEKGINIDLKCDQYTPLQVAIIKKDLQMVEYLVRQGADFNAKKAMKFAKKNNAPKSILDYLKQNKKNNT